MTHCTCSDGDNHNISSTEHNLCTTSTHLTSRVNQLSKSCCPLRAEQLEAVDTNLVALKLNQSGVKACFAFPFYFRQYLGGTGTRIRCLARKTKEDLYSLTDLQRRESSQSNNTSWKCSMKTPPRTCPAHLAQPGVFSELSMIIHDGGFDKKNYSR